MAGFITQAVTGDFTLGDGSNSSKDRIVARWIVHISAVSGTYTPKGRIVGTQDTPIAVAAVKRADGTTVSTIGATGLYDIDASGLEVSLTGGTTMTFSAIPVYG